MHQSDQFVIYLITLYCHLFSGDHFVIMSEVSSIIQRVSSQLKSFPVLTSFAFERDYNWIPFTAFARNNYPLAFGLVIGYLLFIVIGTMIMVRQEKPFDLRLILAAWNALLSIFSFIGMCKTVWN